MRRALLVAAVMLLGACIPNPPAPLWTAGMEAGNLNEWSADGGGGMYPSGSYTQGASTEQHHSGSWSAKFTINTPNSPTSGVRAFRWAEAREHRTAHYEVWLYLPTTMHLTGPQESWNLFQFKSRTEDGSRNDPVWAFYVAEDTGGLYVRAGWGWGGTPIAGPRSTDGVSGKWFEPTTKIYLPTARWTHLEADLTESKDFDGALAFWIDDVRTWEMTDIRTSFDNCDYNAWCADNEWAVNLYSDGLSPNPATVFFDDAAVT